MSAPDAYGTGALPPGGGSRSAPRRVILDVDTGTDDAVAIMLALRHPGIDLVGITTVNGNAPVDVVLDNTLRVVDAAGARVPVYRGARIARSTPRPYRSRPPDRGRPRPTRSTS